MLDAFVAAGHNFLDTADVYGDGDLRAHARAVARAPPRRGRAWPPRCASPSPIPAGRASRPSASCAACDASLRRLGDRRHRPLPGPRARPRRRARGHARGARRPRARRQGARARRLELPRLAAGVGGRASRTARASPPSSRCSRSTRSSSARSRPRSCPSAAPPGSACCRGARSAPASSPAATERGARAARRHAHRRRRPTTSRRRSHRRGTEANFRAVDEARAVADELGASVAQVAIAWLLAQPGVTAPIIGPRTLEQLEDLLPAARADARPTSRSRASGAGPRPPRGYPERMNIEQNGIDVGAPSAALQPRPAAPARNRAMSRDFALVASTPVAPSRLPAGSVIGGTTADARGVRGGESPHGSGVAHRASPSAHPVGAQPMPHRAAHIRCLAASRGHRRCCPSRARRPSRRCTTAIAAAPWPSSSAPCTSTTTASSAAARCAPSSASSAATGSPPTASSAPAPGGCSAAACTATRALRAARRRRRRRAHTAAPACACSRRASASTADGVFGPGTARAVRALPARATA